MDGADLVLIPRFPARPGAVCLNGRIRIPGAATTEVDTNDCGDWMFRPCQRSAVEAVYLDRPVDPESQVPTADRPVVVPDREVVVQALPKNG